MKASAMTLTPTEPQDTVSRLGLTIRAEFVPFSRSRNAKEKTPSLNWSVTLVRDGRDILTTDYSAGMGHCPSYQSKPPIGYSYHVSRWQHDAPAWECENGRAAAWFSWASDRGFSPKPKTAPLGAFTSSPTIPTA